MTDADLALLAFEGKLWKYPGAKEAAVRERFDLSLTACYARLNVLIERPEAEAADPVLVRRLRRLRDGRRRLRA